MRFQTRAFLLCFVPIAVLLTGSFWEIRQVVETTVRNGLRSSLRESQAAISRLRFQSRRDNHSGLKILGENAELEAQMRLLPSHPGDVTVRRTIENQLRDFALQRNFDFLVVADSQGTPVAAVLRRGDEISPVDVPTALQLRSGRLTQDSTLYEVASAPLKKNEETLGTVSVGERIDLSEFNTMAVLLHGGRVIQSTIPGTPVAEVQAAIQGCGDQTECEIRLRGETFLSVPQPGIAVDADYPLLCLQSLDAAGRPAQAVLDTVFALALVGAVLATLLVNIVFVRAILKPIASIVSRLKQGAKTGLLPEVDPDISSIREICDLARSFNLAARAIRDGYEDRQSAYLEFAASLANALDARDEYTAGHSMRVSALACATATALGVSPKELDSIRMAALLHDIGKIGIADRVLQKPGRLTEAEFQIVRQHPLIGRRILEGVHGFAPYLDAVELHHENWDGSGYPHGQIGTNTPMSARILHVVNAFDAMTSDRRYRSSMSRHDALAILLDFAGSQFDPRIVEAFVSLPKHALPEPPEQFQTIDCELVSVG